MGSPNFSYHEDLLHWVWENCHFDFQQLQTIVGDKVQIFDPGQLNNSDGPDFKGAEITIGKLRWHGDVEIHWKVADWKAHGHHTDPTYNNVILHVVFEEADRQSMREDNSPIPTLCLSPYISRPLQSFLNRYQNQSRLPCAGKLSFISEEAFEKQLEKAHKEYFEQKVNDLLEFYDPSLPPSRAWTRMFAIAFFDGLGISYNRIPMQQLAAELIKRFDEYPCKEELRERALVLAGFNKRKPTPLQLNWKHKGCRPANHPRPRIKQGSDALWHIHTLPFEQWMHKDPKKLWNHLTDSILTTPSLGRERAAILFGTVFLPALYSLGNLFFSEKLKSRSWALWRNYEAPIPSSQLKLFDNTALPSSLYRQKLGAVFQLRSYCRPRNCQNCKVFKSAIYS